MRYAMIRSLIPAVIGLPVEETQFLQDFLVGGFSYDNKRTPNARFFLEPFHCIHRNDRVIECVFFDDYPFTIYNFLFPRKAAILSAIFPALIP